MRVAFLTKTDETGPASRYRVYQFLPHFTSKGVDVEVYPALGPGYVELANRAGFFPLTRRGLLAAGSFLKRLVQFPKILRADLIVIEREFFPCFPPLFELLIWVIKGGYILEFDDAIFLSRGRRLKYPSTVRMARKVIVGNEFLADYARRYNDNVYVVPTCLDVEAYEVKASYGLEGRPCIGWIGLPYNFHHLRIVEGTIGKLIEDMNCEFVVISGREPELSFPVTYVPWSLEGEKVEISKFDVGVMPLEDTPFARGKCGLKILQYMAAGVPVVASPVGVNREIIRDGVNGFLARNEKEWEEKLTLLVADERLREKFGREGRKTVEEKYSLSTWKEKMFEIIISGES